MATQKPLKFIHIAKNAGTSIEAIGKEHGLQWGAFDPEYVEAGKTVKEQTTDTRHLFTSLLSPEYLAKYDFFIVVRNPYTRAVSQSCHLRRVTNANQLNANAVLLRSKLKPTGNILSPQHKYLLNDSSVVINIIHFERLEEEFNALMEKYGLPARLTKHLNKGNNVSRLTFRDFNPAALEIIRELFREDFETFGYSLEP